mmetsp:Transcript_31773/g.48641  ORF Transcript_31773/g.48641 Transcript_31773/m.48641 type:complete len:143 (+) Transcript_31773:67-495(+)
MDTSPPFLYTNYEEKGEKHVKINKKRLELKEALRLSCIKRAKEKRSKYMQQQRMMRSEAQEATRALIRQEINEAGFSLLDMEAEMLQELAQDTEYVLSHDELYELMLKVEEELDQDGMYVYIMTMKANMLASSGVLCECGCM